MSEGTVNVPLTNDQLSLVLKALAPLEGGSEEVRDLGEHLSTYQMSAGIGEDEDERLALYFEAADVDALELILLEYDPDTDDPEDNRLRRMVADHILAEIRDQVGE